MQPTEIAEKKTWTDAERLELAGKLDAELDAFIEGLEHKRYEEGWPEDRWQEEMDKHPFFMKKAPQPGEEVHPMFEGLQKLKYDPEENTSEELALNYKEDGNFYMKHKKFRMAICSFTEGIKTKCEKPEVLAVLHNNRSAAHFFIQNYRSALEDAQRAVALKPDYTKALCRAAQCAHYLEKFDVCTQLCNAILELNFDDLTTHELLKRNKAKKLASERDARKTDAGAKKELSRFQKLVDMLTARNIKFDDHKPGKPITAMLLKPKFLPLEDNPVKINDDGNLVWPAAFSYPEFLLSDFQQQIPEHTTMAECLTILFTEPLPCDKAQQYRLGNLSVYYENRKVGCVHKVHLQKTLKDIVSEKGFFVTGGSLLFYIVPKDTRIEQEFIHQQRRPLIYS